MQEYFEYLGRLFVYGGMAVAGLACFAGALRRLGAKVPKINNRWAGIIIAIVALPGLIHEQVSVNLAVPGVLLLVLSLPLWLASLFVRRKPRVDV